MLNRLNRIRRLTRGASISMALLATLAAIAAAQSTAQSAKLTRNDLLVTSDWLATQLQNPKLVLFHVGEKPEYDAGHIPGARFLDIDDISSPMTMSFK